MQTLVPLFRRLVTGAAVAATLATTACDRIKDKLNPPPGGDPQWSSDSALLAAKPRLLFRVQPSSRGDRIVPMATIGESGFRTLYMGGRGWRAFDIDYLQRGHELVAVRNGRSAGPVSMERGMWDPPNAPLDTQPASCPANYIPAARASAGAGVKLLTSTPIPPLAATGSLSAGALEAELSKASTLILPTMGVGTGVLPRYRRSVHTLATGVESQPTIVMQFDDPETAPDSLSSTNERPRHVILILDKGAYGYRSSYRYMTVGNAKSAPGYHFLDFIDVDGDGKGELFFGVDDRASEVATVVLRYENDSWKEMLKWQMFTRAVTRCQL